MQGLAYWPRIAALIAQARVATPPRVGVVYPLSQVSLEAALLAQREGVMTPVLYGPVAEIQRIATQAGISLGNTECVDVPGTARASATRACVDAAAGNVAALMKGSLHTDELLSAVIARANGLYVRERISHTFAFDIPNFPRWLLVADAVVNIAPTLKAKRSIVKNALRVCAAMNISAPKVAIIAATEEVNLNIQATLDAQALVALAREGEFGDEAQLGGPFGMDNAISEAAATIKGINHPVAGRADVLIAPDLNAGNILYKSLIYLAGAECAGVITGAKVPIILTSRADSAVSRVASCALAALVARELAKISEGLPKK
jgi:phosphate acetyltransferase